MTFNKSQELIIGTIVTGMIGIPNIQTVFTKEIINMILQNPSPFIVFLASILKLVLIVLSIGWLIELGNNIEFTYNKYYSWRKDIFWNYLANLLLTGEVTFIIMLFIQKI